MAGAYTVKNVSISEYESMDSNGKKRTVKEVCITVDCTETELSLLNGTLGEYTTCFCVPFSESNDDILAAVAVKLKEDIAVKKREKELLSLLQNRPIRL